ncbi:phage head morphogenesis protein [Gilliamella sp. HK2]|uniref:phage head morphogenesis protein n=1 Tax=unclassified Gilliamella TaxID=2685620 RepID=UPI00080DFFDD|nr:phage minor head protein [Gilliamella apicola]OCG27195.1 phage head morphogenesis protein [Gilliamella apicola]OCG29251.1 phage head morphogenesis protein [Gilliamella apicola]
MLDIDLGYAMKLEPKLAVDYFRSKGFKITWNWQEMSTQAHAQAFTVAKATSLDVLESIQLELDRALAMGITEREFKKNLTPVLQKLGWWGKQINVNSRGDAEEVQLGSPKRLSTIYRTNLATAYQAGRYQQQLASSETHPYWQYIATMDNRTRAAHAALHLKVFRYDDSIWQKLYPPNGWGCRCRVRALTKSQVEHEGLTVESSNGKLETYEVNTDADDAAGEAYQSEVTQYKSGSQTMRTDAGWSGNVGSAAMGSDINIAKKLTTLQNRKLRQQVIQSLNNAPVRQNAFAEWVGNILTTRRAGNAVQPLGFMTDDIAEQVKKISGIEPARLFAVSEKNILHADSLKHQKTGVKLTLKDYQSLPKLIADAQAVLWDKQKNNLLYIAKGSDTMKIVINAPYNLKGQKDALDIVINAYKASIVDLQKSVKGGQYAVLKGGI